MKSAEEIMNILEAYDLTGSFRDAGELAGCSHHTVSAADFTPQQWRQYIPQLQYNPPCLSYR